MSLYVVSFLEECPVKIGISITPVIRLTELQVGQPRKMILFSSWAIPELHSPEEFEDIVHQHFSSKHIRGEWFDVTVEEAEDYIGRYDQSLCGFRVVINHDNGTFFRVYE